MKKIESKRTYLRPFKTEDLQSVSEMMKDPEVMKFTGFREVQTDEKIKSLLTEWAQSKSVWASIEKDSEELIGWFMLKKTILDAPEIGFMITKSKWGRGFATEVSKALVNYAFINLKESKVLATTDFENKASIKVLLKIGFSKTESYSGEKNIQYFEILK